MLSALAPVTEIDRYTARVQSGLDRFYAVDYPQIQLEAMRRTGPGTCELTYAVPYYSADGQECYGAAFVTDLNSGLTMCRKCALQNCPEILGEVSC